MSGIEITLYLVGGLVMLFLGLKGLSGAAQILLLKLYHSTCCWTYCRRLRTSTPELVVSLKAAVIGNSSISLGNVVGSNVANIALILGVGALVRPLEIHTKVIMREIPIMIGVSILLLLLLIDGEVGFIDGLIFVLGIVIYTVVNILMARKEKDKSVNAEFEEGLKVNSGP